VRAAIDARDERLARLEREAQMLARRVIDTEKRMQEMVGERPPSGQEGERASFGREPAAAGGGTGPLGLVGKHLEEIYEQARKQATKIRMGALEDAVQISDRIRELTNLRDELTARVGELAGAAGIKLGGSEERPAVGMQPSRTAIDGVYSGPVQVELGPLRDFKQLSLFQDAAAEIDAASEIRVKRVSRGRATFEMNLDSPVELLRELEERAPFDFVVRDTRADNIVLDLDEGDDSKRQAA
jgi:hypothetical protein